MSRRRRRPPDSSLELLLDTITNTFGGILFLAILVSLLLKSSGARESRDERMRGEPMSPAEAAVVEARLEDLRDQVDRLRRKRTDTTSAAPEASSALDRVNTMLDRLAGVIDAQSRITLETAELQRRAAEAEAESSRSSAEAAHDRQQHVAAAQAKSKEAKEMAADAAARHEAARQAQDAQQFEATRLSRLEVTLDDASEPAVIEQTAGLPSLKPSSKRQVGVYVRFGRLFIMHAWHNGERLGPNTEQFVVIPGDPPVAYPKPMAGRPIDEQTAGVEAGSLRQEFPPARWAVAIVVCDDSFTEFQWLKKAIVEAGFEYHPIPLKDGESVYDSGGAAMAQ